MNSALVEDEAMVKKIHVSNVRAIMQKWHNGAYKIVYNLDEFTGPFLS